VEWLGHFCPGSVVLTGAQASLANFKSGCSQASVVHLATHSTVDQARPNDSYIQLSDGKLRLSDIYGLKLGKESLVVLSSCESGLPQRNAGPEPVCLSQAFQLSGASSVIASLWKVDDTATLQLFEAFYRNLKTGHSRAEALTLAKRQLEADPATASPRYWAGFLLTGTP